MPSYSQHYSDRIQSCPDGTYYPMDQIAGNPWYQAPDLRVRLAVHTCLLWNCMSLFSPIELFGKITSHRVKVYVDLLQLKVTGATIPEWGVCEWGTQMTRSCKTDTPSGSMPCSSASTPQNLAPWGGNSHLRFAERMTGCIHRFDYHTMKPNIKQYFTVKSFTRVERGLTWPIWRWTISRILVTQKEQVFRNEDLAH